MLHDHRLLGGALGAGFPAMLTGVQLLAGAGIDTRALFSLILPAGVLVGGVLGFRHGAAAARQASFPVGLVLAFGVQAVLLGAPLVALLLIGFDHSPWLAVPSLLGVVGGALALGALGILVLGLPMLGLTLSLAGLWALLLRLMVRQER
jgi:hypothetical protein